jgi:Fe-S cluster assembly protein SufD
MDSSKGMEKFLAGFAQRAADGALWLAELRRSAIERFSELGFPTTRDEDWKYTSVDPITGLDFDFAPPSRNRITTEDLLSRCFAVGARNRLVFVDGVYRPEYSSLADLPPGLRAQSLAEILRQDAGALQPWLGRYAHYDDRSFVALNTAFMEDGGVVLVPSGCRFEEPIYIIFVSIGADRARAVQPRNLIICGEASEVKIVEAYVGIGHGVYFANPVSEIAAGADSVVDHYCVQHEAPGAFHVGTVAAHLERGATLMSHNLSLGGALVRKDVRTVLKGEGSECALDGLYLTGDRQHIDNHTEIDHEQPRAASRELYKGILRGRARGVFNGKIIVRKAAQKSDARQTNKNLLLSKDAVVNSKPQLEIFADDVKCSHGSTIGQLDRDALFYLRARGIATEDARNLLSYAFAAEILSRVKVAALRAGLEEFLLTNGFNGAAVLQ